MKANEVLSHLNTANSSIEMALAMLDEGTSATDMWFGNLCEPGTSFITDGHSLFVRERVAPWVLPLLDVPDRRPERAPQDSCATLLKNAAVAASVEVRTGDFDGMRDGLIPNGRQCAAFKRDDGVLVGVNPHKLILIEAALHPDSWRQGPENTSALVAFRDGEAAGMLMPVRIA